MIRYLDICSGYSAITLATRNLAFECAGYAEIDAFPAAVLGYHYGATRPRYMPAIDPALPAKDLRERQRMIKSMASLSDSHFGNRVVNFGDFTQIREDDVGPIDLLAGGTPCQAFSIAGKRLGLDDARGNLTLEFLALARRLRPRWLLWENVAGILSHDKGRTLGTFLGLLGQLGYGWAYRVLDVQYIRVDGFARAIPQRRRRVFVVGYLGDAARAAAVLFERESLRGDPAPRREAGQGIAGAVAPSLVSSGRGVERTGETRGQDPVIAVAFGGNNTAGPIDIATACNSHGGPHGRLDFESETFITETVPTLDANYGRLQGCSGQDANHGHGHLLPVAHALRADGFDASEDGTGRGTPIIPVDMRQASRGDKMTNNRADGSSGGAPGTGIGKTGDPAPSLSTSHPPAITYRIIPNDGAYETGDIAGSLTTGTDNSAISLLQGWGVRRLTPTECHRLMGVPDDFLRIPYRGKPAADGPIYKALGNSQGANVMRWISRGIEMVDAIPDRAAA